MMSHKLIKYNSFAFVLIFFLYSIVTFPGAFLGQGSMTIILSLLTMLPIIFMNIASGTGRSTRKSIFFEIFILIVFVFEFFYYPQYSDGIAETFVAFVSIGTIGLLVGSYKVDTQLCYKYGTYLSYVGLVSSLLLLAIPGYDIFEASMRFGYALLPSNLWFLLLAFKEKSIKYALIFVISYIPLVIYGSRGATLVIILFVCLYLLKFRRRLLLFIIPVILLFLSPLIQSIIDGLQYLEDITGADKIGSMIKLLSEMGEEHHEARNIVYDYCYSVLINNPLGKGIAWWMYDSNMKSIGYPHNIILHIGTEFGLFGLIFYIILSLLSIIFIFKAKRYDSMLCIYIFSISMGRLLVSSTFWDRPEFWFMVSVFCFRNPNKPLSIEAKSYDK